MSCCYKDRKIRSALVKENVPCVRFLKCLELVWNKVIIISGIYLSYQKNFPMYFCFNLSNLLLAGSGPNFKQSVLLKVMLNFLEQRVRPRKRFWTPPPPCQKCAKLRSYYFACDTLVRALLYCNFHIEG